MNAPVKTRITPFVLLQVASLTSVSGGGMMFLIAPWLAIELTGQATAAGLMITLTNIPGLLMSPVVGSVIDKLGRRKTAIWTDGMMGLLNLIVPLFALLYEVNFWLLVSIFLLRAIIGSGNGTARKSLLPDTAAAGGLTLERANGIHEAVFAAGFAIGPALASICIIVMGPINAFAVSGALSLLAALATWLIRVVEQHEEHDDDEGRNLFSYSMQGFRILFSNPSVLLLMSASMTLAVIYLPTEMVILPTFYTDAKDPAGLGQLISIMAIFTTVGALAFERLSKRFSFSSLFRFAVLGVGLSMLPMSLLPNQATMLFFGALLGLAWGPLPPLLNTVIQRKIPANKRGRVFSLEMTIWTAGPMISMTAIGGLVDVFGVGLIYPWLAILVVVAGFWVTTRKSIRDLNSAEHIA